MKKTFILFNLIILLVVSPLIGLTNHLQYDKIKLQDAILFSYMLNADAGIPSVLNSYSVNVAFECFVLPKKLWFKFCSENNQKRWVFAFGRFRKADNSNQYYREFNIYNPIILNESNFCIPLFHIHSGGIPEDSFICSKNISAIDINASLKKFVERIRQERIKINSELYMLLANKGYQINISQVIKFDPNDILKIFFTKHPTIRNIHR